ncbi:MAG: DUF2845 domain-containing protein [Gammaproteobacteria bacterium]|nr:DUF2845 domain-containing protein [Gammaproteobacteria bacterium]
MYIEPAFATSMRCGTHIVTAGMRDSPGMYEVLKRCGEPFDRYGGTWVYKQSSSVSRYVTFSSDGRLLSIE